MLRDFRKVFKGSKGLTGSLMVILSFGLLAYLGTSFQTTHPDSPDMVIARVYGREIKRRDLHQAVERMRQQYGQQDNMEAMLPYLRQQVMGQLMNGKLMEELAERHGVVISDAEFANACTAALMSIPEMVDPSGSLKSKEEIRYVLAYRFNLNDKAFEDIIRNEAISKKLLSQAAALVPVDEAWLDEENRARNEKISFEFVTLMPAPMAVPDPGDEVLEGFLNASGDRFQKGPRRVLQVVTVDSSDKSLFGDSQEPDEKELQARYDARKSSYFELKASHILVRATTPEEFGAAEQKLAKIRARLVAGADFAKVAKEESEDPTAKANSGDLGWFKDGAMVKEFWDGARVLNKGEISQPIKTNFGLHLIKLYDSRTRPFEEVKSELRSEYVGESFSLQAEELLTRLRKRVGEKGDLSAAATKLGLKAVLSDPFSSSTTSTIPGLEGVPNVVNEAFAMKVGQVSQIVPVSSGRFLLYRVQRELPIAVPPLKEIRKDVLDAYCQEEARTRLLTNFKNSEGYLKSLGATQVKSDQTFASMTEFSDNSDNAMARDAALGTPVNALARKTILGTPVGEVTEAVWTNDGKLWMGRIQQRTPPEALTPDLRKKMIEELQRKESLKLLEAELKELNSRGRMRGGFSSLWGRLNGVYINEEALQRVMPEYE